MSVFEFLFAGNGKVVSFRVKFYIKLNCIRLCLWHNDCLYLNSLPISDLTKNECQRMSAVQFVE